MRSAPAVAVRATGGLAWHLLQTLLPACAAGALWAWCALHLDGAAGAAGPALWAALPAGAVALWSWRRAASPGTALAWDGQQWSADGQAGRLAVMIDLDRAILLRLQAEAGGAARWVAVTAREAGGAWHGLRAAVYSRPSEAAPRVLVPERVAD